MGFVRIIIDTDGTVFEEEGTEFVLLKQESGVFVYVKDDLLWANSMDEIVPIRKATKADIMSAAATQYLNYLINQT